MNTTPNDLSTFYSGRHLQTVITSYGENHADTPTGNALHVDTRILRNPPEDPAVRARMMESNGLDPDVRHYVMSTPGARHLVDQAVTKARFLLTPENLHQWAGPQALRVDIHVMCGGGRHRSVAVAEEIAISLRAAGIGVEVEHPHIHRPITPKPKSGE
ncbi:RNase adapter RapZ [Streptomyces atratus]|uniref:RapZ C-terminal domain-containing protein n=1 Tax=Streptomyces atratus TaxID=1893 RepID=UPI002F90F83B